MSPEAMVHAAAGALGVVSGIAALAGRKGEHLHVTAGRVFFVVMSLTAASGIYLGIVTDEIANGIAGAVVLYLLITSWVTVRRKEGQAGLFEIGAFLVAAVAAALAWWSAYAAIRAGDALLGGIPYVVISIVITLAALCDLSVVLRRGLSGKQRIARHLWRMTLGFAAAVGSFFPGQLQIFPDYIQNVRPIIILFIPFFMVIGLMLFWLAFVLFTDRFDRPRAA